MYFAPAGGGTVVRLLIAAASRVVRFVTTYPV